MSGGTENARQLQSEEDLFNASDDEILQFEPQDAEVVDKESEDEEEQQDRIDQAVQDASEDFSDSEDDNDGSETEGTEDETDPEDEVTETGDEDAPSDDEDSDGNEDQVDGESVPNKEKGGKKQDQKEALPDDAVSDASKAAADLAPTVDYESEFKKITAPFKANGRDMQVNNSDEAIQLMQMGANYNKKMQALKPHLKTVKVLEKNGIKSSADLGYLIDLKNKNPQAIQKLIKESGIDPLDLTSEEGDAKADYKPTQYDVSDQEIALEEVLDNLQESTHYQRLINTVSKEWDETSKRAVGEAPQLLTTLNAQMENGIYDVIADEINRQRALGQLNGLSDLQAYKQVGDSIQAENGFDHLFLQDQGQQTPAPATKRVPPKQAKEDPKLKEKRKAAGAAKSSPKKASPNADFNPLSISDEEFEKQFSQKLF